LSKDLRSNKTEIARYSLFAAPLAMAALPIYVHIPKHYAELGLPLVSLGILLLVLRLADAFVDPFLGRLADRLRTRFASCAIAAVVLGAGMLMLLNPAWAAGQLWAWLTASLIAVYFGFSFATIAHGAWGAELPPTPASRATYTASREAIGLIGVLFAAALPATLASNTGEGLARFSWIFLFVLIIAIALLWRLREAKSNDEVVHPLLDVLSDVRFRTLLVVFALNGIASAIPATLLLFFVDDVLLARDWEPQFLISYFLAGALAMPFWTWLARRRGKVFAWSIGMIVAIIAFVWAVSFSAGDRIAFLIVCIATGIALGADLCLPPALLADAIAKQRAHAQTGSYFGVWAFVTKANLALAAGLALPAVSWLGYKVGDPKSNVMALTLTYALLPCALKLCALGVLWQQRNYLKEDI
jgi:glycoside/pentoside/hexuronide:cation symporter, GPH family